MAEFGGNALEALGIPHALQVERSLMSTINVRKSVAAVGAAADCSLMSTINTPRWSAAEEEAAECSLMFSINVRVTPRWPVAALVRLVVGRRQGATRASQGAASSLPRGATQWAAAEACEWAWIAQVYLTGIRRELRAAEESLLQLHSDLGVIP